MSAFQVDLTRPSHRRRCIDRELHDRHYWGIEVAGVIVAQYYCPGRQLPRVKF